MEGRWRLGGMLWQRSPSPPEGHQVPGWGEAAQELGDWELPAHFWGENTSGRGGVLPWPQAHSQALARRPVISPAGQPASPMHGKTPSSCLHRAGSEACTAPSLPSHGSRTVGYVQDPFLLVSGPCRCHAGASPVPVDGLHHAAQGRLLGHRQALALQKFAPVPTNS